MTEAPFDITKAHRWFAVEFNNRAWDLVEKPERSPSETDEMLVAAHGAYAHWQAVGTHLNHLRAECLLATAYASAGYGGPAVRHAEKCLKWSAQVGDEQTDFDRASAHGCASIAYRISGDMPCAEEHQRKMTDLNSALAEPEDRQLILKLYHHANTCGLA